MIESYTHDGLVFDVLDQGPADRPGQAADDTAVVLLHGFPQRAATCWAEVAPRLHRAGLRTLAPDQRGYSPGARPRGRSAYRLPLLVQDVVALVDEVGGPVHLVGHDWGAVVAWALAAERPDLVRSLTAVSVPHPAAFAEATVKGPQLLQSWYVGLFNVPLLVDGALRWRPELFDPLLRRTGMSQEEVDRFHEEMVRDGALPGALGWYRALPLSTLQSLLQSLPEALRRSTPGGLPPWFRDWFRDVTVPTTFVWSDGDVSLSRRGADACGKHVDADYAYVVLEGVSHWIPTHAPEALAEAVLARIASAR